MSIIRLPYSFRPDVGRFSHLREIAVMQTFALNGLRDEYVPDANTAKAFSDDLVRTLLAPLPSSAEQT